MIYKCSWGILSGLILDELVSTEVYDELTDRGFPSTGVIDDGNILYYII